MRWFIISWMMAAAVPGVARAAEGAMPAAAVVEPAREEGGTTGGVPAGEREGEMEMEMDGEMDMPGKRATADSLERERKREERFERRAERFDRRRERYVRGWARLIPQYEVVQFAGSIGAVSLGVGWDYGRREQWETEFLLGYIPPASGERGKVTATLRENVVPWRLAVGERWRVSPLSVGLGMNTVISDEFWFEEPEKYPRPYYKFSTRLRFMLSVGQRVAFHPDRDQPFRRVELYYELSTCDLYVISAFTNRYLKAGDILSLSVGLKLHFL